jgi:ATPase family associated with various cellular activities (AAA)
MTKSNFFQMEHATVVDTGMAHQIAQQFIAQHDGDVFTDGLTLVIGRKTPLVDILIKIKSFLQDGRVVMPEKSMMLIMGDYQTSPALIVVNNNHRGNDNDDDPAEVHSLVVNIHANHLVVAQLKSLIQETFAKERLARIKWWYEGRHGAETREVYLPASKTSLHPEFYPDLGDPKAFMDEYLSSDASVLLLAGPAGTGKTTLLRHLIVDRKLGAHVIYDEKLMEKDAVFQSFLFDDNSDIMVIEDADTILSSRERDGNKMMARFLSVSDGLIKLPNKKLVFTTNISDYQRVDEALLRPGRCFGVIETRKLNLTEAQAASKVAKLPVPIEKREYSIAELFNQGHRASIRTAGFGVRH